MAWTTIVLVSTGELATAAVQNTQVLGNLNELRTGGLAMTSQASLDFIYASSATQLARLAKGATYQVPREIPADRAFALACKWLISAARAKKGKPMAQKLSEELLLALKNEGAAIKKKLDTHRMAEANRAFAHFAW